MKKLGVVLCFLLGGCASATTEYYEAVTAAANANAAASRLSLTRFQLLQRLGMGRRLVPR